MLQQKKANKKNPLWFIGAAGVFILTQGKFLLTLLKFGKFGGVFLSMLVSIGAYAIIFPWSFSIGFVLLILVHELGHVAAAKQKGLPVSAPMFIPFLGAFINMKRHPRDAVTEAYIAIGGPVLGTVGALAVFGAAYYFNSPLLYSLALAGFMINLFNLIPIHPLDGGRIVTAVSRWLWLVGLIGGLVLIIYNFSIILFIIWVMFAYNLYTKYVKYRKNGGEKRAMAASFLIPAEPLIAQGYLIPGEEHKRDLDFVTYSDLEGQQYVYVIWEGLDFTGTIPLMQQALIRKVHVTRLERIQKEDGLHLMLHCQVDYDPFDNDKYFEVPNASRWKYGIAYFALAGFLFAMMSLVHKVGNI
ncbi:site-2 protease family protein [Paenibacillus radicis (ex Xue et al. 2023)]|uniref:Site-2 protease family protein n=1 Tax=Paenibacillus radicis (ex Xue et al. 2023) TaxID=2972489 RepID=A0ABT1YU64_9BACL|nr:site-2 protease family protein [Paenibacillus radicis (ex Xue et al. 2023)]MCR8636727.1 site-2 protease family protein [Paenibacillus radicis (ex Xue et al. 2023)]